MTYSFCYAIPSDGGYIQTFAVSDMSSNCATILEIDSDTESDHENASALITVFYIPSVLRDSGTELSPDDRSHGLGHAHIEDWPMQDETSSTPISADMSIMLLENTPTNLVGMEEELTEIFPQFPPEEPTLKVNCNAPTQHCYTYLII